MSFKDNVAMLQISSEVLESILKTRQNIKAKGYDLDWLKNSDIYVSGINEHLQEFFRSVVRNPKDKSTWEILTPDAFNRYGKELTAPKKLELFWRDMTNQANAYSILAAFKTDSLLRSLVRAANAKDLVAPSMLARGLLEHASSVYSNAEVILSALERVAIHPNPVVISEEKASSLESTLVRSIWGTRIGRGLDAKKKPIWEASPYLGNSMDATNIMTQLQKLSASKAGLDHSVLRIYEWLSDIVHPATQGYRIFWDDPIEIAEGHTQHTLCPQGGSDSGYMQILALWATGYSTVVLTNLLMKINSAVGNMYKHLDTAYAP